MTNVTELGTAAQEQLLNAVKTSQAAVLDSVKTWASTIQSAVPASLPIDSIPGIDSLPSVDEGVDMGFDFAKKVLATQEDFAKKVLASLNLEAAPAKAKAKA